MIEPFFVDDLEDGIKADFTERGIQATTFVGAWEQFRDDARPRVILGLEAGDQGTLGEFTGRTAVTADDPAEEARVLFACAHGVRVWVAAPKLDTDPPDKRSRLARARTWLLAKQTMRAVWHWNGGWYRWAQLEWLNDGSALGNAGAALTFVATFPLPVLDDAMEVITAAEVGTSSSMDMGGGGTEVSEPPATAP